MQVGGNLLGTARPEEPWVNMVLTDGPGVRVTLIGDPNQHEITHFIIPSIPKDEIDSFSASHKRIIVEPRDCRLLRRERIVIDNPDAFLRSRVPSPEEYFEVQRVQTWKRSPWAVSLLRLPRYYP